ALALTMITRTVCPRSDGRSLPWAMMRILPALTSRTPNGGAAQPMSIWPDITCVSVAGGPPVAVGFALVPSSCTKPTTILLELEPDVEYAMVLLEVASFRLLIGESAFTYQNRSPVPVKAGSRMRS